MPLSHDVREGNNWRKANYSLNHGACAEVASGTGIVAIRDTVNRQGVIVKYPSGSWRVFLAAVKVGSFDALS
jgi:CRISPR/Cas system-associated protein Csx1